MVKMSEENLGGGFEEVSETQDAGTGNSKQETGATRGANRPDLRIVQPQAGMDGKTIYKNVGGMWKNVSKNGNEFYTLMIGDLKLLVFPNTNK